MEIRNAGSQKTAGIPEQRHVERREEADSLGFRRGHQTNFADGHETSGAAGNQVRARKWAEERHLGAQRKYSEIYGRRVSRLGLRIGVRRVPRTNGDGTRELDSRQ